MFETWTRSGAASGQAHCLPQPPPRIRSQEWIGNPSANNRIVQLSKKTVAFKSRIVMCYERRRRVDNNSEAHAAKGERSEREKKVTRVSQDKRKCKS